MKEFENIQEAFAYCREADKPVTVLVNGEKQKLFPSGRAEAAPACPDIDDDEAVDLLLEKVRQFGKATAEPPACDVCGQPHPEPLRPIPDSPDPGLVWCALCEWEATR